MAKIDLGSVVGPVGPQGPKPIKGTDYYTEEEKQQFTTETVGLVTIEGTKQTKSVTDEGTKQVQLITEKISEITSTGDLKLNAITTEGKNKLEAVTNEGNRVLSEIGKILETSPEGGNALQLGGKTRSEFDKEIQGVAGGYAGKFPLDSAVLDGIYLLPDTGKFYVCTKAFKDKSLIVPDSNFEELSVYKNRDKLSNLFGYEKITVQLNEEKVEQEVFDYSKYCSDLVVNTFSNVLEILVSVHNKTSNWWQGVRTVKYITWSYAQNPNEIYNINEAPSQPSQLRWEKKKLYIAPYRSNMIVDIFLLKLPVTIIRE